MTNHDGLDEKAVALAPMMERFGLDATDLDMLKRGDMLGSTGAKVFAALQALSALPSPGELEGRQRMKLTKHIVQDGSRFHVISWIATASGVVRVCSCPSCEINAGRLALKGGEDE